MGVEGSDRGSEPGVTGSDRKLLELITELTDEGMVWPFKHVIDSWAVSRPLV